MPVCRQCGRHIHASSTGSGRCWECRHKVSRISVVQTPPHIERRIEMYAARVAAGEVVFRGGERDLLEEHGVRVGA